MGTEILKSFGTLQLELERAKSSLKGFDENIKRLIGRDPSEAIVRPGIKRNVQNDDSRIRQRATSNPRRNINLENDEPLTKRRNNSVFKRLSERPAHYEEEAEQKPQKQMISKVIVTPKEIPSRQEALAAQSCDEKSKARNRRMFGALLGTLQKFQQEETKLKSREDKRAQLEKKIEEHEIREKAEIKKERQELFFNRKKKQAEIKMIELKMIRMKEYAAWEECQKPRMNFIETKAKPHIHYLPRKLNDNSKAALEVTRTEIEKMIDKKRQEVYDELQHIEERMKKNFEPRKQKDEKQNLETTDNNIEQPEEIINNNSCEVTKPTESHDNAVSTNNDEHVTDHFNEVTVKQDIVADDQEVVQNEVNDIECNSKVEQPQNSIENELQNDVQITCE